MELGTHLGFSYFAFCQAVATLKLETRCYAVDTWQGDLHAGFYGEDIYTRVSEYNQKNFREFSTLSRATFDEAVERFSDGSIDLLHIDGRHLYEDVMHDFECWRPKLSERGIVLFHDTMVRDRNFGVHRFWDELIVRYPQFHFTHGYGLGVLGFGPEQPPEIRKLFEMSKSESDSAMIRDIYSSLGASITAESGLERRLAGVRDQVDRKDVKLAEANRRLVEASVREVRLAASLKEISASLAEREAQVGEREIRERQLNQRLRQLNRQLNEAKSQVGLLPWLARQGLWRAPKAPVPPSARSERVARRRRQRSAPPKLVPDQQPPRIQSAYNQWDAQTETRFLEVVNDFYNRDKPGIDTIFVSIILPTYNRGSVVVAAIDSVFRQSHTAWELIIIDDGSDDDTEDRISHFLKDRRVKYRKGQRKGVSAARNNGLDAAIGEFVFYLDSDNAWLPDYLRTMIVLMEMGRIDAAYAAIEARDDSGEVLHYRGARFDWSACLKQNYIDINSFAHRRTGIQGRIRFDETLLRLVDWDFILRVTATAETTYAPFLGVSYYSGARGSRITLSEYPGDELVRAENYVRAKHAASTPPSHGPGWAEVMSRAARVLAAELSGVNERFVDWTSLEASVAARRRGFASIVILALNNPDLTRECIASICECTDKDSFEIVLVNNGSDAASNAVFVEIAQSNKAVRLVSNPLNYMFSVGNNIGASFTRGQYLVFLNNDTRVCEGWLSPLVDALEADAGVGAVGPKLIYPDETLQCGGLVFSALSKIPYHLYRGLSRSDPAINKPRRFQAVTGACLAMRAADFIALKGFDPSYINGCEDLDLCFRVAQEFGKGCYYHPASEVFHLESKTPNRGRYISYNRNLFVDRWRGRVKADDATLLHEDGFDVLGYEKPGNEADGETASYVPVLKRRDSPDPDAVGSERATFTTKTMKVGFSSIWHARGISFHTLQLAEALEDGPFEAHVFARWESEKFENSGPIFHPRVTNFGDDPTPQQMVDWARQRELDLIVFMEVHPKDWKRLRALKSAGFRVMCYENLDVMRLKDIERYAGFDYFLFNAFHARDVVLKRFPMATSLTIPWGVSLPHVRGESAPPVRTGPLRFVHIGGWRGVNDRKNTPLLVRAFDRARLKNAELHVYLQNSLSALGADCVEIVTRNSAIKIHEGTIDSIFDAYDGKDLLIAPSKREGLGLPIVEALAAGLPVLVTDGYMMKQWIVPGEHGLLCRATPVGGDRVLPEMEVDRDHLSQTLETLCASPETISRMAECVARDREIWSWSWQPEVLREQIGRIIAFTDYAPPADLSYLPEAVIAFERKRVATASHRAKGGTEAPEAT